MENAQLTIEEKLDHILNSVGYTQYLTLEEAAYTMRQSKTTLLKCIKSGKLKASIKRSDLMSFIEDFYRTETNDQRTTRSRY